MNIYVAFDVDNLRRGQVKAALKDDVEAVRRKSFSVDRANENLKSFILTAGGKTISFEGAQGKFEIPAGASGELEEIRRNYGELVEETVSVGVGLVLGEAEKALIAAKLRGGDRIVFYGDDVLKTLEEAEGKPEQQKIADEYFGKSEQSNSGRQVFFEPHKIPVQKTEYLGKRAVGVILRAPSGKVLLLHRSPNVYDPNKWGIPGGRLNDGEEVNQALVREAGEEIGPQGFKIEEQKPHIFRAPNFQYHTYLADIPEEFDPKLNWEHTEHQWLFPREALNVKDIHPNVVAALKYHLGMKKSEGLTTEAEEHLRRDHYEEKREGCKDPVKYHRTKLGELGDYELWTVDGQAIRTDPMDIDFTSDANPGRYSYTPINELWIDECLKPLDQMATVVHAFIECEDMKHNGTSYDKAHNAASDEEIKFRRAHSGDDSNTAKEIKSFDLDLIKQWLSRDRDEELGKSEFLGKMALIHDDPQNPKSVWRVENERGKGPYNSSNQTARDIAYSLPTTPSPMTDFSWNEVELLDSRAGTHSKSLLFGFDSPEKAQEWFGEDGLRKLKECGFELKEVPAKKIWRSSSGRQVFFESHTPYRRRKGLVKTEQIRAQSIEDQFHAHAKNQEVQEQEETLRALQSSKALKQKIVTILQQIKTQAPLFEQLKSQAPTVYRSLSAMTLAIIEMAKQLPKEESIQKSEPQDMLEGLFKATKKSYHAPHKPVVLVHFGMVPGLSAIDTEHMGTGAKAEEYKQGIPSIGRAYYYRKNSPVEHLILTGAKAKYATAIDPIRQPLYDLAADEEGLVEKGKYAFAQTGDFESPVEAALHHIKSAGYHGFYNSAGPLPDVVAMFYPQKVQEVPFTSDSKVGKLKKNVADFLGGRFGDDEHEWSVPRIYWHAKKLGIAPQKVPLEHLKHNFKGMDLSPEFHERAKTTEDRPIFVVKFPDNNLIIADGFHRTSKAIKAGQTHINAIVLHHSQMPPPDYKVPQGLLGKSELLEKMSLIHDDPQNPLQIWRVENEQGIGPYYGEANIFFRQRASQRPEPFYLKGGEGSYFDFLSSDARDFCKDIHKFAFKSPRHAENWFGKDGLKSLASQGFILRPIKASRVWESKSKKQLFFEPFKKSEDEIQHDVENDQEHSLPVLNKTEKIEPTPEEAPPTGTKLRKESPLKKRVILPGGSRRDCSSSAIPGEKPGSLKTVGATGGKWREARAGMVLDVDGINPISVKSHNRQQ